MARAALLALALLVVLAPGARADVLSVDFETGPPPDTPVTDEYKASAFTEFRASDPGFRPYRRQSAVARSGSWAADVGPDVCTKELGGGNVCEFPTGATTGVATRTARTVTVYAGLFTDRGAAVTARLVGHRTGGGQVTGAEVAIDHLGFDAAVTVTSPGDDIVRWELQLGGPGAQGATLGFDDLTIDFPAGTLPDVLPGAPFTSTVLQGRSVDVPLDLTRINGSDGPVAMSVTGLPIDVTAEFLPNPVPGTTGSVTMRLTAHPFAPPTDVPSEVTVVADPQGDVGVAPQPRSITTRVRVGSSFDLRPNGAAAAVVPSCATTEVPFRLARDPAFTGAVALSVSGLPSGVTAEIVPGPVVAPGGGFLVDGVVRLRGGQDRFAPANVRLNGSSPGAPDRSLAFLVTNANETAKLETLRGGTPTRLRAGTEVRMTGNGFCPGTRVLVGSNAAAVPAAVEPDGRALTFRVPRNGVTGPVTVLSPGGRVYGPPEPLTVATYRGTNGFQFRNWAFGALSISELTELVGADDLFFKVNPCWPFGTCTVVTGILDPTALLVWGGLNIALNRSKGHCFGMSRTVQEMLTGRVSIGRFATASSIFGIPDANGPGSDGPGNETLSSYLDSRHAGQGTAEFLTAYVGRNDSIAAQLNRLRSELAAGRDAGISLKQGLFTGHVVTAFDMEDRPDGGVDVYVYDNNRPPTATDTRDTVDVIHVNAARNRWEFQMSTLWSGGNDGSFYTVPVGLIPDDPSLPGLVEAAQFPLILIFGSADGSVRSKGASEGAEFVPLQDVAADPGTGGWWVGGKTITHTVEATKAGRYDQVVTGPGFAGGVTDVPTRRGVTDRLSGRPADGSVTFAGGGSASRSIELSLGRRLRGDTSRGATLRTRTSGGGTETAALNGSLTYTHRGAPAPFSFTLTSMRRNGGPVRFESGRLRIGRGERITATPSSWGSLARVRLVARRADGRRIVRTLRNRAKPPARIALSGLRLRKGRASVTVRLSRLTPHAAGGVVLRVRRGRRVVARRVFALADARAGRRTLSWRLPRLAKGRYRLVADARVVVSGERAGSAKTSRSRSVRL